MSRNPVLRKIFGPEGYQKFHNADLHDLWPSSHYSSDEREEDLMDGVCDIYGENRNACRVLSGILKERGRLEDLTLDEIMALKYISRKLDGRV